MSVVRILILAIFIQAFGCSNTPPFRTPNFPIHLTYKNKNGEDLLNPLTQGHYLKDAVSVGIIVNRSGIRTEKPAEYDELNNCGGYCCVTPVTNEYYLDIVASPLDEAAVIRIDATNIDTIFFVSNGKDVTQIKYKDQILWTGLSRSALQIGINISK